MEKEKEEEEKEKDEEEKEKGERFNQVLDCFRAVQSWQQSPDPREPLV